MPPYDLLFLYANEVFLLEMVRKMCVPKVKILHQLMESKVAIISNLA